MVLDDVKSVLDQLSVRASTSMNNIDLEQNPGTQLELPREPQRTGRRSQDYDPEDSDTIRGMTDERSKLLSPGNKAHEAGEHLENIQTVVPQTGHYTTKE
ncbi:hypothetical protein LTR84_011819 [Exophiala bonariae]|uniref:Uncharacterized protein n=1 Tax=Exophiala bonariae TaxID=1690606 RepID=A0AAV9NKQ2_9EURO|nr:hypothetical protein LTR84_011819 [Exophiala bonariae]